MSNFDFMKQQGILEDYSAFNKMYQYLVSAEMYYSLNPQLCGMNVRWALEQFCCLVSDLTDIKYDKTPTYMGEFLAPDNRFKLLLAVRGEVNYRTICEINGISREYAHSISSPNEDLYDEMLPKIYVLIVWLYKVILGIELTITYSSFSYDRIPLDEDNIFFIKKDDVVYTSKEQIEHIKSRFPNCDTTLLYSIRKSDDKFELLNENGDVVETYINEDYITTNEDLLLENKSLSSVQEQLRNTIKIQKQEKYTLEKKVFNLSTEISAAENKISELESNFQTQTEAYDVLVKLKNSLSQEKENLEGLLKKSQEEYEYLNAILNEELSNFKKDKHHLETLLSNAEAQVAFYKTLVDKYTNKMQSNTGLVLANVERFETGYQIYKKNRNEEEFKKVLLAIRFIIDGVREEVKQEKFQRELEKADTDKKIENVEHMVKKNNTVWVALIALLCILCTSLVGLVGYLVKNKEPDNSQLQTDSTIQKENNSENSFSTNNTTMEFSTEALTTSEAKTEYTQIETSRVSNLVTEIDMSQNYLNPDDRLEALYSERDKRNSLPRTLSEIEDISPVFLNEYTTFVTDLSIFYELARWADESDSYKILSREYVPFFQDSRSFFRRNIYTITNSKEIKYVYARHSAYSIAEMYGMAVSPESLSARLSYNSTKNDITDIFGAQYCTESTFDMGWLIPELEGTYGIMLCIKLEDCKIYAFMDENGNKLIDYIFILG